MQIRFGYKHNFLIVNERHGFSTTEWEKWVEQVIEDWDTGMVDITEENDFLPIHLAVGFCKLPLVILCIFERDKDVIRTLYARLATKEEVANMFCRSST